MRTFGVEEELLLVDGLTLEPLAAADQAVASAPGTAATGHQLTVELKQEQLEIVCPPQTSLAGQLEAIRTGRALAASAAANVGGQVVALPLPPQRLVSHLVPKPRFRKMEELFGITADEQLTNGFHVHVEIDSPEEAVAVVDRIRIWLPTLLALSANSPFWAGQDSGYGSYRYQVWSRWPTSGPSEVFGSVQDYERHQRALLRTGVPLDAGMLYFDVRVCEHQPTVEVRITDVCLDPAHAAVIATLVRALVETAARDTQRPPVQVPAAELRLWSFQASRAGVGGALVDPASGAPAPAAEVVAGLLRAVRPVLEELGEFDQVRQVVQGILRHGSGAHFQRQAYAQRHSVYDVVAAALQRTHGHQPVPPGVLPVLRPEGGSPAASDQAQRWLA